MTELERRKRKLLNLPSVENWARNNRPRFDDTLFALSNFDRNPPQFGLGDVRRLCALLASGKITLAEAVEKIEAIRHPAVRASARQVLPAFATYLRAKPIEGLEAFEGFQITYPIGPRPGGGTLAIPIRPKRARLHRAECSYCKGGRGSQGSTSDKNGEWHGPFASVEQARTKLATLDYGDRAECAACVAPL